MHTARSILKICDAEYMQIAMLSINLERISTGFCHDVVVCIFEYIGIGSVILNGVKMAYLTCTTNLIVNQKVCSQINVRSYVWQNGPISPLLFEPIWSLVADTSFSAQA